MVWEQPTLSTSMQRFRRSTCTRYTGPLLPLPLPGEVHGISLSEKFFALCTQLVGTLVLFGIIQGGVTSMLTNLDVNQFRYKMRVAAITNYLRDQNQPSELVREVNNFYRYLWERSRGMSSSGLFDQLPFALRSEISLELTGKIFDKSPLFQNINASFLRMLSLKFRPMLALPDQIVMKKGELSNLMVYVQKGHLEVLSDDENEVPILLLKPGKVFGEINLITRMPRKYSVRAIAHCDLVILRTEDLMACLQAYPEIAEELRRRAEERAGMSQQQTQEGILAGSDTNESARMKKQEKDLATKLEELTPKMGTNIRSLMSAMKIRRPQERLRVSESMELFRIRDPMDELVDFHTSAFKGRIIARYHHAKQTFLDFSLDPDGIFLYFWDRFIVAMILCTFIVGTYSAFFKSYNNLLDDTGGAGILVLVYFIDIVLYIDFAVGFLTQIITPNGNISNHRAMAFSYLGSWSFWVDVLAIIPMEIFTVALQQDPTESDADFYERQMHYFGYLRLNRCIKAFKLPKFFDRLSDELATSMATIRTIKFCIYIILSSQLGASILIAGTCSPEHCPTDPAESWTAADPPNITIDFTFDYRYSAAMYYAVTLLTSAGYGDIFPRNLLEQFLANVVMLIGMLMYGYCLAVLTATLANLDGPRVEFQERLFALKGFMEYNRMAELVKRRAIDSVALLWTISKGEDIPGVKSMTADLPEHLTEEIQVEDLIHLVAGVPIFKNIEENILKNFAPAVRRYLFPPGEYIIQHGDLINELFVIRRGVCQIFHPEQPSMVISELYPGMYFGEIGFLFNHNEIVSVKTITHCEVLTIPRPAFDKVASSVKWFSHQMKVIAHDQKYYADMCGAARLAKALSKKRREESPVKMSETQKRRLRFRDDFNSLSVHPLTMYLYRLLMNRTISVDGRFLYIWEQIRLIEATVIFVLVLMQVTYQLFDLWLFVILYLCDIYAFVDIYIKFHVQYFNETNILVTHPYMTARRYLRSSFWIDLLAAFPFELGLLMTGGGTLLRTDLLHAAVYLRMNRILQVYRVPQAFAFYESDIKKDQSTTFLIKFLNYFILFVMFATAMPYTVQCTPSTCGFNVTSCNTTTYDNGSVIFNETSKVCMDSSYLSLAGINSTTLPWDQFVGGFYWAITTVTVVGYGDIRATNESEHFIFLSTMIAGYIFFNYIIASIAAAQANSDARRSRFFDRLKCIKQYMHHEHLSKKLKHRIVRYYEYLWLRTHGIDPQTLIAGLPPSLTSELALQLYRKVIEQVSIFKNTPTGFKKMLATIMKPLYVMEGEYVIRQDDVGTDLFFMYRGSIEVHYSSGFKAPQQIRSGRMIGEVAFFRNETSRLSFRAAENSDLYYVTRAEFDAILEHFPDVKAKLVEDILSNLTAEDDQKNAAGKTAAQARRHRFRDSLAAVRKKKVPTSQRLRLMTKHIFRSDDKYIRYFSKYFVNMIRMILSMLIMYQVAFTDRSYAVHYVLESVFLINIIAKFRTGFLDEFGNEVLNPKKIRQRYLKHGILVDLLISFPYEVFSLAAPVDIRGKVWAYLRLLKVPPMVYRVLIFFHGWLAELDISILFVRLTYSFTQLLFWLHFFCCVAYYIACPDGNCDFQNAWTNKVNLENSNPGSRYIVTLYWITTTATTAGYGDIVPTTNLERIFICIVQVAGKFLFGIIVGDIASTLANLEVSRQNFESRFQAIKTYLLDQQANSTIIDRVQKYFDYLWKTDKGVDDINSVLNDAPFCLRAEICFAVHQRDLRELPLFRDASDAFLRMISTCLHQVQFVPGDYVIQQGDLVEEMYFLHRGEVVEVESGVEIGVLRRGSNVNWQALLIDWPASRTVRATDNCEVYVLTRTDLEKVVSKYSAQMGHICMTNRIRLRDLLEEEKVELD
ncbi:uncharacterized protein LOC129590239 isoform X2 [Paramacrobiotus metropolitanus]|uniref:uncharacterized protein LOC129590239 isoform X2 n=1 Tax=Paramacrobiotus metropolitanus TaxID=2943436 RepID=UPI0024463B9B|nr:uncharacterized protein LOC129590239 isoform X2 [Paramacrobiotus metropolitanus]